MGQERGGRLLPIHPAQGRPSSRREQQLQQQVEERLEPTACWKREQVQSEPERDLCGRPGGEGRLHGRRRKSPRLPGTFRKMDRCRPRHLGGGMCQRCPWSLREDVTFHSVDRPKLEFNYILL